MFVAVVMASEINRTTHEQDEGVHGVFSSIKQVSAALGQRFGLVSPGLTRLHGVDLLCDPVVWARTPQAKGGFYPVKSFVDNDSSSSPLWSEIILFNFNRTV